MTQTIFQDFQSFLKNPKQATSYTSISPKNFILLLLGALIIIVPSALLMEWVGLDQFDSKLEEMMKDYKWLVATAAIFLAPLIEEPIFRLHLDLKKASIWWGIGLSVFIISEQWYIAVGFVVYLVYLLIRINNEETPDLKFVVYTSAIFFGLVHLGNYSNFNFGEHFYWIPFLVGMQFFIGLILSFLRLNHGIRTAMLFHGVYNAVLIIPYVYFYEG
jgi:uncharacterized protein